MSDDSTRPISVAELLARNGTIGAPPVSGRRRRRRGNSAAVTVAELTGEIPVIRVDDEPPVAQSEELQEPEEYDEYEAEEYVAGLRRNGLTSTLEPHCGGKSESDDN